MDKNNNSLRGFTLVELLAVIVVLAIVMLIALQAVLPAMDSARRQTFAIEANGAIDAANTYFVSSMLTGDPNSGLPVNEGKTVCVEISTLYQAGYTELNPDNYSGKVEVVKKGNLYLYTVYIEKNKAMMVNGAGSDADSNVDIDESNVVDYNAETFKGTCD